MRFIQEITQDVEAIFIAVAIQLAASVRLHVVHAHIRVIVSLVIEIVTVLI